jgi:hypothetical protein
MSIVSTDILYQNPFSDTVARPLNISTLCLNVLQKLLVGGRLKGLREWALARSKIRLRGFIICNIIMVHVIIAVDLTATLALGDGGGMRDDASSNASRSQPCIRHITLVLQVTPVCINLINHCCQSKESQKWHISLLNGTP